MKILVRKYEEKDLTEMIQIWNEIVEEGNAFPQEEILTLESGREFFALLVHIILKFKYHNSIIIYRETIKSC